jgi:hypothetical protein
VLVAPTVAAKPPPLQGSYNQLLTQAAQHSPAARQAGLLPLCWQQHQATASRQVLLLPSCKQQQLLVGRGSLAVMQAGRRMHCSKLQVAAVAALGSVHMQLVQKGSCCMLLWSLEVRLCLAAMRPGPRRHC